MPKKQPKKQPSKQPKKRGRRTTAGDFDLAGDFEPLEQPPTTRPHAKLWETLRRGRAERAMLIATGEPLTVEDAKYGAAQRALRRKGGAKSKGRTGQFKVDPERILKRYKSVSNQYPQLLYSKICEDVSTLEKVGVRKVREVCKAYKPSK